MSTTPDQDSPGWRKVIVKVIDFFRSCFSGPETKPEDPFPKQATKGGAGGTKPEDPFRHQVFKDIAEVMAKRIKAPPAEIETALRELADHERDSPALETLRRIDCEIVKQSPTHAQCTVLVALIHDGDVLLQKITRDVPWENLPQPVRADFIRSGQKTQSFVVIERQVKTATPPKEKTS